jgi:SAM-dependent methyltransferase
MDDIARDNRERWNALVAAGLEYTRPWEILDAPAARALVDPYGQMGDVRGHDVLVLAGGGGQQTLALATLGANVTTLDLSDAQLEVDRAALAQAGLHARLEQGDMRDLSRFADRSFDVVWHAWSLSFVPDTAPVFDEVARVLRPGGLYQLICANPAFAGMDETTWNGSGYQLPAPYRDGSLVFGDPYWDVEDADGQVQRVLGPHEFRHTLGTLVNGLIGRGFRLLGLWEEALGDVHAESGSYAQMLAYAPRDLVLWACLEART